MANRLIYEKIEKKGVTDAEDILALGRKKAAALEEEAINEAQKEVDEILEKCENRNKDRIKTQTIKKEQWAKQRSLSHKKDMIDRVFARVHQLLKALNDADLYAWVLATIKREALDGNETLRVSKDDLARYRKLFSSMDASGEVELDRLNQDLGKQYKLKLSDKAIVIDGGFQIQGTKFDIDCSFKTQLEAKKEEMETIVAHLLFEEESA